MRHSALARWLPGIALAALAGAAGCAENSLVLQGQANRLQQQQLAMSRQLQELQGRAAGLDRDNQELGSLLAQARQKNKLLEDQLNVTRDQLTSIASQLAQLREEKKALEQKAQTLTASLTRQGSVSITPNNSLLEGPPTIDLPGVQTRRDGDVVRVELAASALFDEATGQWRPNGPKLVADVAAQLYRLYPSQRIGVEGHTDGAVAAGSQWRLPHQLSTSWAMAVYDVLITQSRFQPRQLFVAGHGGNHPIVSNATPAGRQRNRRVELVIYPDRITP